MDILDKWFPVSDASVLRFILKNTVFIVGAGASTDFDLPTGLELKDSIQSQSNFSFGTFSEVSGGDQLLRRTIDHISMQNDQGPSKNDLYSAATEMSSAMAAAPTIDNWINLNRSKPAHVLVGKLAIVLSIVRSERGSKLFVDGSNRYNRLDYSRVSQSWLAGLAEQLLTAESFEVFLNRLGRITFVTFNYDRCIEQFFLWLVRIYYPSESAADEQTLRKLNILHVYGSLGSLTILPGPSTGFGAEQDVTWLRQAADNINTFTEGSNSSEVAPLIANACRSAELLCFLGFGFHRLNMQLLPEEGLENLERLFVTKRGLSDDDVRFLKDQLFDRFGLQPSFDANNANDVFSTYRQYFMGPLV